MQGYQVSARKYRPPRFDELVGQEHITKTLRNAIAKEQLAQAYLFCGPRGVGKTSCARIFAKTINCQSREAQGEACGQCRSCQSFEQGLSLAIHELDAASNNSVDDIRSLVEQVRYPPQGSTYKVYIIDEVHMLSTAAFNALLKTLEEPPSYAKFILATTEKHKILPTILSRCQIFDFKRIRLQDMADRLAMVCKAEGIRYEEDALLTIASRADGALRDALTMLDQLAGFGTETLSNELVSEQLGVLDPHIYLECTEHLAQGNLAKPLEVLHSLILRGFDPVLWVLGMATHCRNLIMAKTQSTLELLEVGPEFRLKLQEQSERCDVGFLLAALHLLNQTEAQYRQTRQPRLLVEAQLMKICYLAGRSQSSIPAASLHPLEGISHKMPPAGYKTPASVRVQTEVLRQERTSGSAPTTPSPSVATEPHEVDRVLHPPGPDAPDYPTERAAPTAPAPTTPAPPHENLVVPKKSQGEDRSAFLQKIQQHLGNQGFSEASGAVVGQSWNPPGSGQGHSLRDLWQALLQQTREKGLGGLEGILARNIPTADSAYAESRHFNDRTETIPQNDPNSGNDSDPGSDPYRTAIPIPLRIVLYSDTENNLFQLEKGGLLEYLVRYGPSHLKPFWEIVQEEADDSRRKFLTEQERFSALSSDNQVFMDFKEKINLFLI